MTNKNKARGTAAETAVVNYLRSRGFVSAERRAPSGAKDCGDIAGLPGVVVEVKNCARMELASWVAEVTRESRNAHASTGVVWHKRRGVADPGDWFVTMDGRTFVALLREAMGWLA